jgi:hypothetical protein
MCVGINTPYPNPQEREQKVRISAIFLNHFRSGGVLSQLGFILGFLGGHRLTSQGAGRRRPALGFDGGGATRRRFFVDSAVAKPRKSAYTANSYAIPLIGL